MMRRSLAAKWIGVGWLILLFLLLSGCSKEMDSPDGQTTVQITLAPPSAHVALTENTPHPFVAFSDWLIKPAYAQLISDAYPFVGAVTLTIIADNGLSMTEINEQYNDNRFMLDESGAFIVVDVAFSITLPTHTGYEFIVSAYTPGGVKFYAGSSRLEVADLESADLVPVAIDMQVSVDPAVPRLATDSGCPGDDDGDGICNSYEDLFVNVLGEPDVDSDTIINSLDADSDNDGILDDASETVGEGLTPQNNGFPAFIHKNNAPTSTSIFLKLTGSGDSNLLVPVTDDQDVGDLHQYVILTQPEFGTVVIQDGELYYLPDGVNTGTVTFTFQATDSGGLTVEGTAEIIVEDPNAAPTLTLLGNSAVLLVAGDAYVDAGATATDNEEGDLTSNIVTTGLPIDTAIAGSYVIEYRVNDSQGLQAVPVKRQVQVSATSTAPVITLLGSSTVTLAQGQSYSDAGATASDVEDGDITSAIVTSGLPIDTAIPGSYTITYNVTDSHGVAATQVIRTVVVDGLPLITLLGNASETVLFGSVYSDAGATASDPEDGDITASIAVAGLPIDTTLPGSYTITYDVTDSFGSAAPQVTRTVVVLPNSSPVITLNGSDPTSIILGSPYVDAGATASDAEDGDITASILVAGATIDTSRVDSHVVSYQVTDSFGVTSSLTRVVKVVPPVTYNKQWLGNSSDWMDGANWSPSGVPTASDSVYIPLNVSFQPQLTANTDITSIQIENSASLDLQNFTLTSSGSVIAIGNMVATSGGLVMTGGAVNLQGVVPSLAVRGVVTLLSTTSCSGNLSVDGTSANLVLNGQALSVAGDFATVDTVDPDPLLTMSNISDLLNIAGNASFDGGDTSTTLTAGEINLAGNFTQGTNTGSFKATGGHKVVFSGSTLQNITFATAGASSGAGSHFNQVVINNSAGVYVNSTAYFAGDVTMTAGSLTDDGTQTLSLEGALIDAATLWSPANTVLLSSVTSLPTTIDSNLYIRAPIVLNGGLTVNGSLLLDDTGANLTLNGNTVNVVNSFAVGNTVDPDPILVMTNGADQLNIGVAASFMGGDTSSSLTAGTMTIGGGFAQGNNTNSFKASGTHTTVFNGGGAANVSFLSPGDGLSSNSHFANLQLQGNVSLLSDAFVEGSLVIPNANTPVISSSGNALFVRGVAVDGAIFDNALLGITDVNVTQLDNVEFNNYSPTLIPLVLHFSGVTATFNNLKFSVAPSTGYYIQGDGLSSVITIATSLPSYGESKTSLLNGFSIVWGSLADDSDNDGMTDADELAWAGGTLDPLDWDTDDDGISDYEESVAGSDPLLASSSPLGTPVAVNGSDDFEVNDGSIWTPSGSLWEWGAPLTGPGKAYSGVSVWGTVLSGNYGDSVVSSLYFPPLDLTALVVGDRPTFAFRLWAASAIDDGVSVERFNSALDQWEVISPLFPAYDDLSLLANPNYPGWSVQNSGGYQFAALALDGYLGEQVKLRLTFRSDASGNDSGVYIDNPTLYLESSDPDGDGVVGVRDEYQSIGTDPFDFDTDQDGLSDGVETNTGTFLGSSNTGTNPLSLDYDSDKVIDGAEVRFFSDPTNISQIPTPVAMLGQSDSQGTALTNSQFDSGSENDVDPYGLNLPGYVAEDNDNYRLFVSDAANHRVTVYPFDSVTGELTSRKASFVLGQADSEHGEPNRGGTVAANTLNKPGDGFYYNEASTNSLWFILPDSDNHRVLFFDVTSGIANGMNAAMVLGQGDMLSNQPNQGKGTAGCSIVTLTSADLYMPSTASVQQMSTKQLLFVSDTGNHRVLGWEIPSAGGIAAIGNGKAADYVLGQPDTITRNANSCSTTTASTLDTPTGLASIDQSNQLLVADTNNHRIMGYDLGIDGANLLVTPSGMAGLVQLGQILDTDNLPNAGGSTPTELTLNSPRGLYVEHISVSPTLLVADSGNHRVMEYDGADGWLYVTVYGQPDQFSSAAPNPTALTTLNSPGGVGKALNSKRYFADTKSNRVTYETGGAAGRAVLGQTDWLPGNADGSEAVLVGADGSNDINGVAMRWPADVALATVNSQNTLFVADAGNSRVTLHYLDGNFKPQDLVADMVFGANALDEVNPGVSANQMDTPEGVVYDSASFILWVADTINNRVLGFDLSSAFANGHPASYVLGQGSFLSATPQTLSANSLVNPMRLALGNVGATRYLFVTDEGANRVLMYNVSDGVTINEAAAFVLGQPNMVTSGASISATGTSQPAGIDYDETNQRLFVADKLSTGGRVLVWDLSGGVTNGMAASYVLGQADFTSSYGFSTVSTLMSVGDVAYDSVKDELWVSDTNGHRVLVFDLADGIANGEEAKTVLGQPDYNAAGTFIGSSRNEMTLHSPSGLLFDSTNRILWIPQYDDNRILILQGQ